MSAIITGQPVNISRALFENAEQTPDKAAIVIANGRGRDGKLKYNEYSFATLAEDCTQIVHGFNAIGLQPGTRTVLMVKPSFEFFSLMFSMLSAGIIPILIDPGMGLKNLKVCLAEAQPEAFIGIPKAHAARMVLGWSRKTIKTQITVGRKLGWKGLSLEDVRQAGSGKSTLPSMDTEADATAALLFTSGSTGVPKGVVYSHRNFMAQVEFLSQVFQLGTNEVDLATFPPFALFDPALGMTSVIPEMDPTRPADVNPDNIFDAVNRYQVTHMFGSPALLNRISRAGEKKEIQLPSIRRVLSAGAPVPNKTLERMLKMLPAEAEIYTPYGATECLPVSTIGAREILAHTRSKTDQGAGVCIGKPVKGIEVQIIHIDDDPIPQWNDSLIVKPGKIGEIVVKGPNVTTSYFNRPGSTTLAKIQDGESIRHRMGDLGYFDETGRLWFCGRKAHRVKTEDEVFYTLPCEAIFNTHPDVYRTALVNVTLKDKTIPLVCVELEKKPQRHKNQIKLDLLELAARYPHTQNIRRFLFHPGLPVDIRHNSKIFREKLSVWASQELSI